MLVGMSRIAEEATAWVVRVLRPIPGLAWVPFAIIWFGVNPSAAVFIIAIGVFWIVFFAAQGAIRGVDRDLIEVADAFGFASPWQRLTKILLPEALPGIVLGLTLAAVSLIGYSAMVGAVGGGGLGDLGIRYGYQRFLPEVMAAVVLVLIVLVQLVQSLGEWIARRVNKRAIAS
mgnify:CR=1 FL=1